MSEEERLKAIMRRAIDSSRPYLLAHGAFLISQESWAALFKEACPEFSKLDTLFKRSAAGEKIPKAEAEEALDSIKFVGAQATEDEPGGLDADLVMLMKHQSQGMFHPYTCRDCHGNNRGREAVMVPVTRDGLLMLKCPYQDCGWEQVLTERDIQMVSKVAKYLRRKGG